MDHSQPFPSDPNSSVDEIDQFLKDYSISAPDRQPLTRGASYGYLPPRTEPSRARSPIPALPPLFPAPRQRLDKGISASTTPSMTFDDEYSLSPRYASQAYADSMPATAPSSRSTVLPGNGEYVLPCEFVGYDSCDQYFSLMDADQWMDHIIVDHLQNWLPNKSNCWFCDHIDFDARRDRTDKASSFRIRLEHIRSHIRDEGLGIRDVRPDYNFVAHLWRHRLISRRTYEAAQRWIKDPASNVTGLIPHDFIPEEQIQREERSQTVVFSKPRERSRRHRAPCDQRRAAIPDTKKKLAFKAPADTSNSEDKQYYLADLSKNMISKQFRLQKPSSDYEEDNEDNFECETDDENIFQNTERSMEDNRMEASEAGPSVHNNRRVGVAVDLENSSPETINSNTSLSEDCPTKSQRDATISRSSGSPEPGGALTPDSSDSFQGNDALHTSPFHRQVGFARLRIEQLSLFDDDTTQYEQYADVSICSDNSQRDHDDCPAEAEQDASGSQHSASSGAQSQHTCQSTKRPRLNTGNEMEAEDSDPDEDQGRTKSGQKRQKKPSCGLPRFACPYQAFETFQNCFEPHARNPKGGCEHISRLKHHLKRRHTQAYRCRRCWSSFDSCEKVKDHEAKEKCNRRTMPQNERFMDAQSEAGIEKACKSVPATEAWWNLFRLLIPGMQGRDLGSLIQQFGPKYPYYFRREPNLLIPSVTLSNNFFEPVPQAGPNQESVFTRNSDHQDLLTPRDFNLNMASTTYAMQPMSSQTFSVPVFQNFNVEAAENNFIHPLDTPEASTSALGGSSLDFSSSSSNLQSLLEMPFMSENTASASSVGNQGQLQRNYERLRERNIQAEADIVTSRQAVQEAGSDLILLNNLFEDLLNSGNLPDELFDKISEASSTLTSARRKLQRCKLT